MDLKNDIHLSLEALVNIVLKVHSNVTQHLQDRFYQLTQRTVTQHPQHRFYQLSQRTVTQHLQHRFYQPSFNDYIQL
jgi:hypothetical protein